VHQPREVEIQVIGKNIIKQLVDVTTGETEFVVSDTTTPVDAQVIMTRQDAEYAVYANSGEKTEIVPGTYDIVVIGVQDFNPPWIIAEDEICSGIPPFRECEIIDEVQLETLPLVYLEQNDVEIGVSNKETLIIEAPSIPTRQENGQIRPIGIQTVFDLEILEVLFEHEAQDFIYFQ
jgi:hypothetical protein